MQSADNNTASRIDWSVLSDDVIRNYGAYTGLLLSNVVSPRGSVVQIVNVQTKITGNLYISIMIKYWNP